MTSYDTPDYRQARGRLRAALGIYAPRTPGGQMDEVCLGLVNEQMTQAAASYIASHLAPDLGGEIHSALDSERFALLEKVAQRYVSALNHASRRTQRRIAQHRPQSPQLTSSDSL